MNSLCKTYYVDAEHGSDANTGSSQEMAFATLAALQKNQLQPGDHILLARGSVFEKQFLQIRDSGTAEQPIVIDAYGEGEAPVIAADGQGIWYQDYGRKLDSPTHVYRGYVSSAVLLYDASHVTVQNIEITNRADKILGETYSQPDKMQRTGVSVVAKDKGVCTGITLRDLKIHDVHGNVYDKHMNNGGIYMTALQPVDEKKTGVARFSDITVEQCFVYRVSRWGIAVGYTYAHEAFQGAALSEEPFLEYGNEAVVIRDNYVKQTGGDAITVMYALRPLVTHNMADCAACEINDRVYKYPGERGGKVAAAIWPWKCKDAKFFYNEVVDTRLNQDGMAYDADSGDGTVYAYNYSRQNEGGCVMFCMDEAVHSTFCNNVSFDDLGGTVSPSGNPDARICNNVFYRRKGVPFVRPHMDGGAYTEKNNIYVTLDAAADETPTAKSRTVF